MYVKSTFYQVIMTYLNSTCNSQFLVSLYHNPICTRLHQCMLPLRVVDCGIKPWSCQTKDFQIGICCFSSEHASLRSQSKEYKNPTKHCQVQNRHHHLIKCDLFLPLYSMQGPGGSMSQVVGLPNNSYKPITNTAWVRTRLCKLQKRVHSTRSRK